MEKFPVEIAENEAVIFYGIGVKTKEILDNYPELNVAGLMDETHTGAFFYGKKVLSESEIQSAQIRKIIIIARRSNVKIIYRRIADFCEKNNIAVYDISGVSYPETFEISTSRFHKYSEITRENLKQKIDSADVISFDIFDTLLIRTTLFPADVFVFFGEAFAKARIAAERAFYAASQYPDIYAIYEKLTAFSVSPADEIALEKRTLLPRTEVVDFFHYAKKQGKKIFLTSDMYLPKEVLAEILSGCGIEIPKSDILVSCGYNKSKENGLFEVLIEKSGGGKILHIGDSYEGDILSARKYGVHDTFYVPSVLEMLEDSFARELLALAKTPAELEMVGRFAAYALRDPFLFSETGGKFSPKNLGETAEIFIAPIMWRSYCEIIKIAEQENIKTLLLGARDGFLFYQIYKRLSASITMHYFLISRALAVLAAIKNAADILESLALPWNGDTRDLIKTRFNIASPKQRIPNEADTDYILRHSDEILKNAEETRARYLKFIEKLGLLKNEKIGFFDFVSSGTCQKALAAITDFDLTGIYIIGISHNPGYKSKVPISAVFGNVDPYKKSYNVLENYLLLENITPSADPTIAGFDNVGNPVYIADERDEKQLADLKIIQNSIINYCESSRFSQDEIAEIDKKIPDIIFSMINPSYFIDNTGYIKSEIMYDEFLNRTFGV